ncbi:LapA family protein [Phormidium pseudopriestleyi FRX01]|uniref:LapA family protein n=1 Tax=Phormidium pseudopriestleyi FRX01 TaxID=1759528 RepID=A0ABS3FLD1_9CYAN|nr:LapA family protein [Phormidium pseudopriestleyi]MBO0347916.1 LapA family protein [Phormidium pseudopriestleyi FRX01]
MREFRNVLLLVVLGGLTIFALQNTSPSLSLVFLGMKSIALPLSAWILAAIALGVFTAWAIAILFRLYHYWDTRDPRPRRPQRPLEPVAPPPPRSNRAEPPLSRNNATVIQDDVPNRFNRTGETGDRIPVPNPRELEEENWIDEDEDFMDEPNAQSFPESRDSEGYNYEVVREPVAESWVGSSYSYSYEQNRESGGDQGNSPYNADYRIVTPPPLEEKSPEEKSPEEKSPEAIVEPTVEELPTPEPPNSPSSSDDWTTSRRRQDNW